MKKLLSVIMVLLVFTVGCISIPSGFSCSGPSGANRPPTAYIDSITPPSVAPGEKITFVGHGTDVDGTVVAYRWRSSISGELSSMATFDTKLDSGNHIIYFKVQDNNGNWSAEVRGSVNVSEGAAVAPPAAATPVISSFIVNPVSIITGGSSVLDWDVSDATTVSIDQGIGNVGLTGTRVVFPGADTVYTLTATNTGGTATASVLVIVLAVPSLPPAPSESKPDLVITDITRSGSTISYTIMNQGTATAGPSTSRLVIDGLTKAYDAVGPLSAGASSTESFSYSYSCSGVSDSVAVQADKDNVVDEGTNEGNNAYSEFWSCLIVLPPLIPGLFKPDLVITDITRSGSTISYIIKNQGTANSGASTSQLRIDGVNKASDAVGPLAAGASSTESFSYSYSCTGSSDIVVVQADKDNVVDEGANEGNNTYSETWSCLIFVPPPLIPGLFKPDLVITNIWRSGGKIWYTIKNQGTATAGASSSRLVIDGSTKGHDAVGSLAAGVSSNQSFTFPYICTWPLDTIRVIADEYNVVDEGTNEGNNDDYSETWPCP